MPDELPELPHGGIDIHPDFVEIVMPHVKTASEWVLHEETVLFYIACHLGRPDLIVRLLDQCDGDMDRSLKVLEGSVYIVPGLTRYLEHTLDAMEGCLSRWPPEVRQKLISYVLNNHDCASSLDRLLGRYERHGREAFDFVVRYPSLAGTDPDVLEDAAKVSVGWSEHEGVNVFWMHEFVTLVSVFGRRWREWVDACDPGIDGAELIGRVHVSAHVAGLDGFYSGYKMRSSFKGLGKFLFINRKRMPAYVLRLVAANWNECGELARAGDVDGALEIAVKHRFGAVKDDLGDLTVEDMRLAAASNLHWMETSRMKRVKAEASSPPPPWSGVEKVLMDGYEGVFLDRGDPTVPYIGSIVGCCQHLGGAAKLCAIHSAISPRGAVYVVRRSDSDDPIAMSWVWERDGVVVFDNIEGPVVRGKDSRLKRTVIPMYVETASRMVEAGLAGTVTLGIDKVGVDGPQVPGLSVWPHTWPMYPEDYLEIVSAWGNDLKGFGDRNVVYPTDSCLRKAVLAGRPSCDRPINPFFDVMDDPEDLDSVIQECRKKFAEDGYGGPCGPAAVAALLGTKIRDVMALWPSTVGVEFPWKTTTNHMMAILEAVGLDASIERCDLDAIPEPMDGAASISMVRLYPENRHPDGRLNFQGWHWIPRVGGLISPFYSWVPVDLADHPEMRVKRIVTVRRRNG